MSWTPPPQFLCNRLGRCCAQSEIDAGFGHVELTFRAISAQISASNLSLISFFIAQNVRSTFLTPRQYSSIGELAEANQVDRTYVSRLLQLTSLAPDLVESLLAGDDCEGLSLRQLRKGIPLLWSEQRESFGN